MSLLQRPLRLSTRILLTFVTLMTFGLGSLIGVTGTRLATQTRLQLEQELQLQAETVANGLRDPFQRSNANQPVEGRSLGALLSSYGQALDARVTLLDNNRQVMLSSDSQVPVHVQAHSPELEGALGEGREADIRQDPTSQEERMFVAAPVRGDHGEQFGYIQLSVATAPIDAQIRQTWLNLIAIGGIVLLATILASVLLARQIIAPVERLTATSEKIAAGQLNERVTPAGPREVLRLGTTFNAMAERVQEMLAQQRDFVDNAAHELRTPLTGLSLRLELLQAQGDQDPTLRHDYLQQMSRQITALRRIVDHLLALAAAESNANAPRRPLDLSPLLYDLADDLGTVAQQAGVTLTVEVPDHLPRVEANPEQMNIAVRNLLDNAIKYTPEGGTVTLSAGEEAGQVQVRVSDTGQGIPPDALPHIFERFYRIEQNHSTPANGRRGAAPARLQGGAGLGLALVQTIVKAHGGEVTVTSRVNAGSVFVMTLPVAQARRPQTTDGRKGEPL
ncbi:MAG: ATP-binding protein [Anaerolineae bacterium]